MTGITTLETLINKNSINIDEYGLKAKELAHLAKLLPTQFQGMPITIPPGFIVPSSASIKNPSIEPLLNDLTATTSKPVALMVRSSDPNERPGIYESVPIIHDPKNQNLTLKNWQNAANVVRDSGASAIFTQQLAAEYQSVFEYSFGKVSNVFGSKTIGFVANSWSVLSGPHPVIHYAWGLPSKLVRGDEDICMMFESLSQFDELKTFIINGTQNYWAHYSPSRPTQKSLDVLLCESSSFITTIKAHPHSLCNYDLVEYRDYDNSQTFALPHMLALVRNLRKNFDCEIELEGTITDTGINFVQLRQYSLPQMKSITLSAVEDELLIARGAGFGYERFVGDLYIVHDKKVLPYIPREGIIHYAPEREVIVPSQLKGSTEKILFACTDIISMRGDSSAQHELGLAIHNVVEFENLGVRAIGVHDLTQNVRYYSRSEDFSHRVTVETYSGHSVYKVHNITAEAVGNKFQVFFNKE